MEILATKHLNKYFYEPTTYQVLKDINLSIHQGEFVSVIGKSGCGKSTLLYVLSTMDTDYDGELWLDGELMHRKSAGELAKIRNAKVGFVFQFHYLLHEFTVLKNVMLPGLKLGRYPAEQVEARAMEKLTILGMQHAAHKPAHQLSGGEKQRVAIARALINDPLIIMADEPTGNLDRNNSLAVFDIFQELSKQFGQTLLVVTHDHDFAKKTDRTVVMDDGSIVSHGI